MISKELIDELRKNQFELRCEKVMKTLQKLNQKEYLQEVQKDYKSFILLEKNYFSHFLDILSGNKLQSPPASLNKSNNTNEFSVEDEIHIKSLNFFILKLMENDGAKFNKNITNPDFIHTLTYSLFPSISTYFHINKLPKNKKVSGFSIHNYNNVFLWLSNKIKENTSNQTIYQNAFDILMQPMFCSPMFINFCINFFQPIFSNLQNQEFIKKEHKPLSIPNFFTSQFRTQFKHFAHLVPPYIALNLQLSDDPVRTLANSFFKIAFKSTDLSQYYGLFHFSRPPSKDILDILQKYFINDQESNNQVLNCFIKHLFSISETIQKQMSTAPQKEKECQFNILTCSCPENDVQKEVNDHFEYVTDDDARIQLALDMKNYYFENDVFLDQNKCMFRKILLSSNDIELLNYIYSDDNSDELFHLTNNDQNSYKWVNFGFNKDGLDDKEEKEEECLESRISQTMANSNCILSPNVRHILQNSDPIPEYTMIPEKMTIESFFEEYLVKRGPLETLSYRKACKKNIFNICSHNKKKDITSQILSSLKDTALEQTNDIELLTMATKVQKKVNSITFALQIINDKIEIIDYLSYINNSESNNYLTSIKTKLNQDYIKNPPELYDDFLYNKQKFKNQIISKKPQLLLMKMIDRTEQSNFQIFGKKLSSTISYQPIFLDFLSSNPFVQSIDISISNIIRSSNKKILNTHLNKRLPDVEGSRSKTNKNQFLVKKIINIRRCRNEIILRCKEAFADLSIFRKVELFSKVVNDVILWIIEDAPNYVGDIGSDEIPIIISSVIFLTNPPYIASNIYLLQKMFFKANDQCFGSHAINMITYSDYALIELQDMIENDENLNQMYQEPLNDISKFNDDIEDYSLKLLQA